MKYRVCVLGATGLVGQRMVSILSRHPWFYIESLMASERSSGRRYGDIVKWVIDEPFPDSVGDIVVSKVDVDSIVGDKPDIVFSALPSAIAKDVELELVRRGLVVVSNASPYRMESYVPVLNPEVNADHIELARLQERLGWSGFLFKVPNCTTAILTLALKPLVEEYGVRRVIVSTMQALSGAGYYGVPSIAILDNIIPFIKGEEEKVESETRKILGRFNGSGVDYADIGVSASCHRVMVLDGHLESVFVETTREVDDLDNVKKVLEEYSCNMIRGMGLPTAPDKPVIVRNEIDRPQPRLDRMEGRGMSIVVGRIRIDHVIGGLKFIVLGHNTIRGAAGTAVLIAELVVRKNLV